MQPEVLRVENVVKRFSGVTAVAGVSFEVRRGEVFALLGPNGAGKTTMVRMLLDLVRPDEGAIAFPGLPAGGGASRGIGYLPEERGLYREMPIRSTVEYMARLRGFLADAARRAASGWLERVGLADRASEPLERLSKGNQQLVQFAAAVVHDPPFAILDEPFSGLDPVNQERMLGLIGDLRSAGTTILLSAHQMELVERLADRVLLMHRGARVLEGTIPDLLAGSTVAKNVILRTDGTGAAGAVGSIEGVLAVEPLSGGELSVALRRGTTLGAFLREASARTVITDIRTADPTLHEVFLSAVGAAGAAGARRAS